MYFFSHDLSYICISYLFAVQQITSILSVLKQWWSCILMSLLIQWVRVWGLTFPGLSYVPASHRHVALGRAWLSSSPSLDYAFPQAVSWQCSGSGPTIENLSSFCLLSHRCPIGQSKSNNQTQNRSVTKITWLSEGWFIKRTFSPNSTNFSVFKYIHFFEHHNNPVKYSKPVSLLYQPGSSGDRNTTQNLHRKV